MALEHAYERFEHAVRLLCVGRGPIRQRLSDAFTHQLAAIQPESDVPESLRAELSELLHAGTGQRSSDSPTAKEIEAAIGALSEDEAVAIAEQVLAFAYRIEAVVQAERKSAA